MAKTDLADRVRGALGTIEVTEQAMFGGICFMLNGNMLVGASPRGLLVRVGKDGNDAALARPHAKLMEQGGRSMAGYIVVANEGVAREKDLRAWLDMAVEHVRTLPAKQKKTPAKKPAAKGTGKAGR